MLPSFNQNYGLNRSRPNVSEPKAHVVWACAIPPPLPKNPPSVAPHKKNKFTSLQLHSSKCGLLWVYQQRNMFNSYSNWGTGKYPFKFNCIKIQNSKALVKKSCFRYGAPKMLDKIPERSLISLS